MRARSTTIMTMLAALAFQAAFSSEAYAQQGALYYDAQTAKGYSTSSQFAVEGMAWGYFHTGALSSDLTLTANDPITIQLFDEDSGEYGAGGSDELQLWMSDTNLTALAGESVRFEFFSVVPSDLLEAAGNEGYEGPLELRAQVLGAPGAFASEWGGASWSHAARSFTDRASTFSGYPAADHVVRLYYVYTGQGFGGTTPSNNSIPVIVDNGNKKIWGSAAASDKLVDSSTTENIWNQAGPGRGMHGFILVENTSDRDGLTVNLDFMELLEDDGDTIGNDDDLLGEANSTAPANFNLGPGGTLKWKVSIDPEWEAIEDAGDLLGLDGDLEPYAMFSVNGDPELPIVILSESEVEAVAADLPPSTFSFGAAQAPSPLPPPPVVAFTGAASSYTVDEDVVIGCTVTDGGGGVVFDTCFEVDAPAWSYLAGTTTYNAEAYDVYGQQGSDSVSFTVEVTYDSLIAITERFVDHNGIENSLTQKIRAAERARNDNAQDAGCQAFINEVEAQAGNHVDEEYAEVLIYWAGQLMLQ